MGGLAVGNYDSPPAHGQGGLPLGPAHAFLYDVSDPKTPKYITDITYPRSLSNTAYGIWMADRKWEQHPQKYARYPFNEFYRDWGPGGEWGLIKSYKIYGSATPKGGGSGVVVEVVVNNRAEHAQQKG